MIMFQLTDYPKVIAYFDITKHYRALYIYIYKEKIFFILLLLLRSCFNHLCVGHLLLIVVNHEKGNTIVKL
jgi:hypothetical protein